MNITLVEFDIGTEWNRYQITAENTEVFWFNYSPGVYVTALNGDYSGFDSDLVGASFTWYGSPADDVASSDDVTGEITRIGSVFASNTKLDTITSLASLIVYTGFGYYYDDANEILYIKTEDNYPIELFSIVVGLATLTSNKEWIDETNNNVYDAVISSLPSVTKAIDPLFFGKIQFNNVGISLENSHGEYDNFADFDVYGQELRILFGDSEDTYSSFTRVWTGYIDDFALSEDQIQIRASDSRKLLEKPIPVSFFSSDIYADLEDRDDGKPIPVCYGSVKNVTPICIDKAKDRSVTPADYTFVLCDVSDHTGIEGVDEVRYKGEVITPVSTTIATATIVLDDDDIEDANGRVDFRDIEVDFTGLTDSGGTIENGLDVIADMIEIYGGIPYSSVNYNTTDWAAAVLNAADVGLYIEKDSTISEQIETIAASLRVQFDVQGDGKYTVREFDPDAVPTETIREDERFNQIQADYTSDEFASRLYVNYIGGVLRYTQDEQDIIDRYKTTKPATFDTVLTSAADATAFAEDVFTLVKDFPPLVPVETTMDYIDVDIEDNVYAILNRVGSTWFGRMLCRVEGISYDFNNERITLSLRAFESVADEVIPTYITYAILDTADFEILDTDDNNIIDVQEVV